MSTPAEPDDDRWVDVPSAVALTGIRRYDLVVAIAGGEVRWSVSLPGHERVPMVALADVRLLAELRPQNRRRAEPG